MINRNDYLNLEQDEINLRFTESCEKGNLEVVKYLLTSPELKEHADIHVRKDLGFVTACYHGHLEVVKYLLTSPELKEHSDIHAQNDSGFIWACQNGHLDVVKYLLTSPDLKDHAHLHTKDDDAFINSCFFNRLEIIQYLIFDVNIEKTEKIENYLKEGCNEQIENMFKIRELINSLDNELKSDNINNKKVKL